jgi:hypothetical protein
MKKRLLTLYSSAPALAFGNFFYGNPMPSVAGCWLLLGSLFGA